ncbi:hypothetical protein BLNAU_12017 [Blattamonas nauphoetae]|uniref:Uncharacterized protein n=1 Tax=Blattamonas nauphoetae TaxID=2049346 RepID=A0ABQ9XNV6_9EUKA|nr:hypothetical protein BLNAU_12017 [Blattamonas nauphoetae]
MKLQPVLDVSLEAKAVNFLKSVETQNQFDEDIFLTSHGQTTAGSSTNFVQSIVVLISSPSQAIATAAMKLLARLIEWCSHQHRLALVKADLIPQLIASLNPQSLSFTEAVDIHINVMKSLTNSLWLGTPDGLTFLKIEDRDGQQAVHKTIFQQVVAPSEKYIWHLCVNRFSIIDGDQSFSFLQLLTYLLKLSPYFQPSTEFLIRVPVILTIPSCLTFFKHARSIYWFLYLMVKAQLEWNMEGGEVRQTGKTILRMLRMEGIEDILEKKLRNDENGTQGGQIVTDSINLNNLLGMNIRAF